MAEKIIQFPTKSVRDWETIRRALLKEIIKHGASQTAQDRILERLKSFYEIVDFEFNISMDFVFPDTISTEDMSIISTGVGEQLGPIFGKQIQAFTKRLYIERLKSEVDFCIELGIW